MKGSSAHPSLPSSSHSGDSREATYVGHATVLLELGGARVLTDPLLRDRLAHLRRQPAPPPAEVTHDLDGVLISHAHLDHLDPPSLRRLDRDVQVVAPAGTESLLERTGFKRISPVVAGDAIEVSGLRVTATPARHDDRRRPIGGLRAAPVGFVIEAAGTRIYFAGDTDLFPGIEDAIGRIDLALLPVWGWGPSLGDGHMDPQTAARAAALLRPRIAVPIHWGTYYPIGVSRWRPERLSQPPLEFARHCAAIAPDVDVRVLEPGESTKL